MTTTSWVRWASGFKYLIDGLNSERIVVGLEGVGIGQAALELATNYANERVVFDRPIGQNQAVAHPLADSWIRLESARLMAMHAAELYDDHQNCGIQAAAAKYLGAEAGFEACDRAMSTHGGYAYAKEYHVERLWREARLLRNAPLLAGDGAQLHLHPSAQAAPRLLTGCARPSSCR